MYYEGVFNILQMQYKGIIKVQINGICHQKEVYPLNELSDVGVYKEKEFYYLLSPY